MYNGSVDNQNIQSTFLLLPLHVSFSLLMHFVTSNMSLRVNKMAQWVKALDAKPGDLNPIPGTHMEEEEI